MSKEHADITFNLTPEIFWQFSLHYYEQGEVKEACLALQNQFNGNVNLLLLLVWMDENRLGLTANTWQAVQSSLASTDYLLQEYRELRRQLKHQVSDTLYRESLQFELLLEKQQQAALVACINRLEITAQLDAPLAQQYCQQLGCESLYQVFSSAITPNVHL